MGGFKYLYIVDSEVYPIPHHKDWVFKSVAYLANKEVLMVTLNYETYRKKPSTLGHISFDRIQLDENGGYAFTNDVLMTKMRIFAEYGFFTPEDLNQREELWIIPDAPIIPTKSETSVLRQYLKDNFIELYKNFSQAIYNEILVAELSHKKHIELIKEAAHKQNRK